MDRRIFHIQNLLSQSLGRSWTVEEMAEAVELSVPHFRRLFLREVGIPPKIFLNNIRLEAAHAHLSAQDCFLQIQEIAQKCGLGDISHFSRHFKNRFGMSPTEFRLNRAEIEQSMPPASTE